MRKRIAVVGAVAGVLLMVAVQARAGGPPKSVDQKDTVVFHGQVHRFTRPELDVTGPAAVLPESSTVTIFSDGFEGSFPGQWSVQNETGTESTTLWGKSSYRAASGSYSAWCAGGGTSPQSPGSTYVPNMDVWLVYGPFSLVGATAASLDFDLWLDGELNYDYMHWYISVDNSNWSGYTRSASTGGWSHKTFNFSDVTEFTAVGAPQVWVGLRFTSDGTNQGEGAYVDNVVITKTTGSCTFSLSSSSQSFAATGGTGSVGVTVTSGSSCSWTATSNASSWLHVTSGASGTGNGTVGYAVDANSGSARSGTLTIAGQTFTVNQSCGGGGCGGGTVTIFSDNFEGSFPGQWQVYNDPTVDTGWGRVTCKADGGTHSVWCAAGGGSPQPPCSQYIENMGTAMVYGPFSLADAVTAKAEFDVWYDTEEGYDGLGYGVSLDGTNWYYGSLSGNSGGWVHEILYSSDVTDITIVGAPQVWFALLFASDGSINGGGVYVDNVVLTKTTTGSCTFSLSSGSHSFTSAGGTGSVGVTVTSGSNCSWTATSDVSWLHVTSGASGTGNGTVGYAVDANTGSARSGTLTIAGQTFTVNQSAGSVSYAYSYWLPVISHTPGAGSTQWRSDVWALNRSGSTASIELMLYTGSGTATATHTIPGNGQVVYPDLAASLGMTNGSGALQVLSTQPLLVTSRTYNLQPSGWTYGQGYDGIASSDALEAGSTAWLPQLAQTGIAGQVGTSRVNIGITNTGSGTASVTLTLYDANGTQVLSDTRSYTPGQFYQYQEPYRTGAGRTNIAAGYAKITVNSGSGIIAYASDTDNASGDPMTINMKP